MPSAAAARRGACGLGMMAALMLAGCVSAPRSDNAAAPWLQGRLVVKVAADAGKPARSDTAAFELRGDSTRGELRLSTPLGNLVAVARWAPGEATLVTPQGRASFAGVAELAREALGEELPLQALPDWLQGRAWSGAAFERSGDRLVQLGWQLDLARFDSGLLLAERAAPPAVSFRVQLER